MSQKLSNSWKSLQEFIKDWHARKGLNTIKLACELFEKLYTEEYQKQSFLKTASEFIENFWKQLDSEFENKCLIVFKKDCYNFVEQLLKKRQERLAGGEKLNEEEIKWFFKSLSLLHI
ncbi:hypothetical protein WEN_01025 [Mycoplasma wenyonii str. Massachusetts]|uniref:Uncharacterized protein n=1 Tax=Mycoplasma wenyonii (strain Massachusetts) TaxID=1197325 RepID=I6YL64_MYCWM|nr:hypothetical protein [Mycoplasma wenyonii]AFN65004.1 hypothetical protein WEN_01025 [Mycoplasma wenyonii str. Massachusetts]